jgi:hypothetical protein
MGLGKTYSTDYLVDSNGNTGVAGQILVTTATGVSWQDAENTGDNQTQGSLFDSKIVLIDTPNGGLKTYRVITDEYGEWIQVGRFAANAMTSIQSAWSSVSGLSTGIAQSETTQFSADFGDSFPTEVRVVGATDFNNWRNTRTIDWIYKSPEGRKWKYFFSGGAENGMTQVPLVGAGTRWGWSVNGAYDGFGRWTNATLVNIGMSDFNVTNPSAAYSTATANAFNWEATGLDAKLTVNAYTTYSGQDEGTTSAVGNDDNGAMFFDTYPVQNSNNSPGGNVFSSAVWVLIKLPGGASGSGGGGGGYWAANGLDIYNTNADNVGIGTSSPQQKLHIKSTASGPTGIIIENTNNAQSLDLDFWSNGGSAQGRIRYEEGSGAFAISPNVGTPNAMYINYSNRVGIGTTNPTNQLHVHTATDNAYAIRIEGSTNNVAGVWTGLGIGGEYNNTKSAVLFEDIGVNYSRGKLHLCVNTELNQNSATPADAKLTVSNDGNVGIGTSAPDQKLTVNGRALIQNSTTPFYIKVNSTYKSWVHHIASNDTYVLAPSTADGGETWDWPNQTSFSTSGVVTANNFVLSSDKRNKTKIEDLTGNNVNISWKSFEMKGNEGEYRTGVIAQELEENHPEFVNTDEKGFKSVKYIDLLIAKISELEARLEKIEK